MVLEEGRYIISPMLGYVDLTLMKKSNGKRWVNLGVRQKGILDVERTTTQLYMIKGSNIYDFLISKNYTPTQARYITSRFCSNTRLIYNLQYITEEIEPGITKRIPTTVNEIIYKSDYNGRLRKLGIERLTCPFSDALEEDLIIFPIVELPYTPKEELLEEILPEVLPEGYNSFFYIDQLVGRKKRSEMTETYRLPHIIDNLPEFISPDEYDGALTHIHHKVVALLDDFFNTRNGVLWALKKGQMQPINQPDEILEIDELSWAMEEEGFETRIFELQILPAEAKPSEVESSIYGFKYMKGEVVVIFGFPAIKDDLVKILKEERAWE